MPALHFDLDFLDRDANLLSHRGPDIDIFSIGLDTNTSRTLRLSRSILKNAIRQL